METITVKLGEDDNAADILATRQHIAKPPVEPVEPAEPPQERVSAVYHELSGLFSDLKTSPFRNKLTLLAAGLFAMLIANMAGQVYLNQWQGSFFSAVERKDAGLIGHQVMVFLVIVVVLLGIVVVQTFFHEIMKLRIREWLTSTLLDHWLMPGRAYRLGISANEGVNPDQRIQEDARHFSELSADLGVGLLQALLLLLSFIGVLWVLSSNVTFNIYGEQRTIPGYMVWAALIYAAVGSWLTWRVGRPLIPLNSERYAKEADLRFSLVRVSENAESVALYAGEGDERRVINQNVNAVIGAMRNLSVALSQLTWITSGYGWFMIVVPTLIALPGYIQGTLNLGGLMMVVGAFTQVQSSLRWFVDNFAKIADWRAALHRVSIFREAIRTVDDFEGEHGEVEQITLEPHGMGHLAFKNVSVHLADGGVVIEQATAYITPGQRVLITGESGSGKSTLFRAVAGLWVWGSGTISLPPRDEMMFLPQRPYIPLGTLEAAVSYPKSPGAFTREQIAAALTRVHLESFIAMLDEEDRWDKLMSLGQQQRLAFARVLLHKPKWVFLDEATAALDDENQDRMMRIFTEELSEASIMSIGHRPGLDVYHTRTLDLVLTPGGARLRRKRVKQPKVSWIDRALEAIAGKPAPQPRKAA